MKIVHLLFSFKTGGAENLVVDLVNRQCLNHHVSLIVVNDLYDMDMLKRIDSRVYVKLFNRKPGYFSPFCFLYLNLYLLWLRPDMIHCHNENIIGTLFPIFYYKCGLTVHDTFINQSNIKYLPKFKVLFAISQAVQLFISKVSSLPSIIVNNGIDFSQIQRSSKLMTHSSPFRIVQIGRLIHSKKGQHLLIEAVDSLIKNHYEIEVDFIGEGESFDYLNKLIDKCHLQSSIHLLGNINRNEIYTELWRYDLLVQPSLYEGFGLTVVEGIAAGVPVLASDLDGPSEIINNQQYGYLFQSKNVEDLASKIKYIIDHYDEAIVKADDAYQYAKKNFDVSVMVDKYLSLYHSIQK